MPSNDDREFSEEFIREQKRRAASPGPWYSGHQVREMIGLLEETWQTEGGFDKQRMAQLVAEFEAKQAAGCGGPNEP